MSLTNKSYSLRPIVVPLTVATGGEAAGVCGPPACCDLLHAVSEARATTVDSAIAGVRKIALFWVLWAISDFGRHGLRARGRQFKIILRRWLKNERSFRRLNLMQGAGRHRSPERGPRSSSGTRWPR